MKAAGNDMGVLVKMNMRDGFKKGMDIDESLQVARELQNCGAHALVLSGGFVSKAPMYVMRGEMPVYTMTYYMDQWWLRYGVRMFGKMMVPSERFKELYFLEDARKFRHELPNMPLVYVGGVVSRKGAEKVLEEGFEFVQMGRALLNDPAFVNKMKEDEECRSGCDHINYCIARMYSRDMACHKHCQNLPPKILKEIDEIRRRDVQNR